MPFNITVAIVPTSTNLQTELQYVKSALLYADKVELISPVAYLMSQLIKPQAHIDERYVLKMLERMIPFVKLSDPELYQRGMEIIRQLKPLISSKKIKQLKYIQKLQLINSIKEYAVQLNEQLIDSWGRDSYAAINTLINNNQVSISHFQYDLSDSEKCVYEYFEKLKESVNSSSPLFDKSSYELINAAVQNKLLKIGEAQKSRIINTGFVDNCFQRLPSFEQASVDELIDIKKELSSPLIRFRGCMLTYSEQISSLPWDEDFESECDNIYAKEIAPAVLEVEEAVQNNSFKKNLGKKFLTSEGLWKDYNSLTVGIATTGILTALNNFSLDNYSLPIGVGAALISKFLESLYEHKEEKEAIEKNELYFYYKVKEKLLNN